jgi:hypothetical protein
MQIPALLRKRLEVIEHAVGRVRFVLLAEWDVELIQRLQEWSPRTEAHCLAIQQEENRRQALVLEALRELEAQALDAGEDHLTFRVYGSQAGLVRIASSLGAYELDVPCLPGRRCRCWRGMPMVFVYRVGDDPHAVKVPDRRSVYYLHKFGLEG